MPLIIAEAGVNHNGDLARALDLVDAAAAAGADVVKFQAFSAASLTSAEAPAARYQAERTGSNGQRSMLETLQLGTDDFRRIAARCQSSKVAFLCTPFDLDMLDSLIELGMPAVKVASGELTNRPALERFGATGLPILLSTGMATLAEVEAALATLRAAGAADITVLHCTSLYPAPPDSLNLRAIESLRAALDAPVGYSDHSEGVHMAVAAAALGATVIEKHLTLDRRLPGPDHAASLEPPEFATMVSQVHEVAVALGDGVKRPAPAEQEIAFAARRSWHAARDLGAGRRIEAADAAPMRPAAGIPASEAILGRTLRRDIAAGAPIRAEDLSP